MLHKAGLVREALTTKNLEKIDKTLVVARASLAQNNLPSYIQRRGVKVEVTYIRI